MENFNGLRVKESEFALQKIIMHEEKNLTVKFIICQSSNEGIYTFKGTITCDYQANENLQERLRDLHQYLCLVRNIKEEKKRNVKVKGLELSGSGDKENFKIYGIEISDKEKKMACDTYKIHYEDSEYMWVEEIRPIAKDIELRVYKYLFAGEKAQLTLGVNEVEEDLEVTEVDFEESEQEEIEE